MTPLPEHQPRRLSRLMPLVVAALATLLVAGPASAATQSFPNPTPIKIPGSGTEGPASPYPSSVSVSGMAGPVTDVNVALHKVGHTRPDLMKALLVSPSGDKVNIMNSNCGDGDIEDFTWLLDQQASNPMSRGPGASCPDFVYRPNAFASTIAMPAPAPAGPYRTSLDAFNGENPNGMWRLYVATLDDTGDMEGGWTLTLTTRDADTAIPGTGTSGVANPYPAPHRVAGETGVITDLDVRLDGIWHQRPEDLDLLLVGPQGKSVVLMSNACGTYEVASYGWIWDDEAPGPMPDGDGTNVCGLTRYLPTDRDPGDSWPAPAPGGPHVSSLSAFDLTEPNGEWRLYVNDDTADRMGFFTNRFQLLMTTRPKAKVAFSEAAVRVAEGQTRELTLRRSGPGPLGAGAVTVASVPASASPPGDFTPVATSVQFARGETEKTVRIDASADGVQEPDEAYAVAIGSATGDAEIDSPSSVTVTIPTPAPAPIPPDGNGGGSAGPGASGAAPRCAGKPATIVGTARRDVLRGTRRRDVIVGLSGNDLIKAARGNDTVCAGAGNDRVSGQAGRDRITGGAGDDRLSGGTGRDTCLGGPGRDRSKCEQGA